VMVFTAETGTKAKQKQKAKQRWVTSVGMSHVPLCPARAN